MTLKKVDHNNIIWLKYRGHLLLTIFIKTIFNAYLYVKYIK